MPDSTPAADRAPAMHRPLRWLLLALVVVVLDLGTKLLVTQTLAYGRPVEVLPVFNLMLLHNTGAAFSFLADHDGWQRWLFAAIATGAVTGLVIWLKRLRRGEVMMAASLALIMGGAVGNLYDRVVLGYVVDFLSFHWDNWYFPAFNLADTAICLGAAGMILDALFGAKNTPKVSSEAPHE
ncbi:signal peptidase II [Larsenimonas rhizosphaerae]|uniref:Lipoprotein signal peptidase n=1 Tax=Larsenimonas rhizosphaerae TaxID=2944682 RepID=A0AA41ZND1_9GAMM|nr:signal peptidase II [Larsenimonas rhizosphaerae]MCX2525476.1 signal peptidase II [Larsenimonas rhizosphaerae]